MKKLFVVTIETEIVVAAETPEEAVEAADDAHRDLDSYSFSRHAMEMTHLPADWDLDSIPYGAREEADPDRTIKNWIDAGAAEKYTALREKLSKTPK